MNYLFVHQNFPGQFKYLAPSLAADKANRVVALSMNSHPGSDNLEVIHYKPTRGTGNDTHPFLKEFETKVIRGDAAYRAAQELKKSGFHPDAIIAHPGWGESLFLKDVWPETKLGIYCEFFYQNKGADVGFDPEFESDIADRDVGIRMKNLNNLVHLSIADAGISPTHWQADTFPADFRSRINVVHDGINTELVKPNSNAYVTINNQIRLDKTNEVITFVNRNLEPYRGYHTFMRAMPQVLKERPHAHVIIVGGDKVSYGRAAPDGQSWKNIFLQEVIHQIDRSRVHFVGNLSYQNFLSVLQVSTVHVYLTYPFVLSWSLMESMSAGCAVIASDTGPVREVIRHGENGRLVDFFNKDQLAGEIIALLANPASRESLGKVARQHIIENYDLQSICLPRQMEWANALADL